MTDHVWCDCGDDQVICCDCGEIWDGSEELFWGSCDAHDYGTDCDSNDDYEDYYVYCYSGCVWLDCGLDEEGTPLIICDVCHGETSGNPGQIMTPEERAASGLPLRRLAGIDMSDVDPKIIAECFARDPEDKK